MRTQGKGPFTKGNSHWSDTYSLAHQLTDKPDLELKLTAHTLEAWLAFNKYHSELFEQEAQSQCANEYSISSPIISVETRSVSTQVCAAHALELR